MGISPAEINTEDGDASVTVTVGWCVDNIVLDMTGFAVVIMGASCTHFHPMATLRPLQFDDVCSAVTLRGNTLLPL